MTPAQIAQQVIDNVHRSVRVHAPKLGETAASAIATDAGHRVLLLLNGQVLDHRRTLEWVATALPVLATMCKAVGLEMAARKAEEMVAELVRVGALPKVGP